MYLPRTFTPLTLEYITIITPVYNNVNDIENCLMSVAQQSYDYKEHWIIDGGSNDGTLEIITQKAIEYKHIKWLSEKDNGIYEAINKGIERANGDWIYVLGSDDELIKETILEEIFNNSENLYNDILYGNILLKESNTIIGEPTDINGLKSTCTHHQATFIRKSVFAQLGKYDIRYRICADWAFTIKAFHSKNLNIKYINNVVAKYSTIGFSNTFNGNNPRLRDKKFNADFFSLFNHFSYWERALLRMDDYLPVYLNPRTYLNYLIRFINK